MNKEDYLKMIRSLQEAKFYCGDLWCKSCPVSQECDIMEDSRREMVSILTKRLRALDRKSCRAKSEEKK